MKNIFMALVALAVIGSIAIHNWKILLVIPFALGTASLNFEAIKKNKVGKLWHSLQFAILVSSMVVLVLLKLVKYDEIMILTVLYYLTFETSLNALRKRPLNYIGKTSFIDKTIRKIFKKQATINQVSYLSKFLLLFIAIAIYLTNKPF